MDATTVTIAEAARNLADLVNRAHLHQETTTLVENGEPVAQIVPVARKFKTNQDLAAWLDGDRPRLGPEEAAAFEEDLRAAREMLREPVPPEWD